MNESIEKIRDELTNINVAINESQQVIAKLRVLKGEFDDVQKDLKNYFEKYNLEGISENLQLKLPMDIIEAHKNKLNIEKKC